MFISKSTHFFSTCKHVSVTYFIIWLFCCLLWWMNANIRPTCSICVAHSFVKFVRILTTYFLFCIHISIFIHTWQIRVFSDKSSRACEDLELRTFIVFKADKNINNTLYHMWKTEWKLLFFYTQITFLAFLL